RPKVSLSKQIKDSVKTALSFIDNFEQTAADIAIDNGYDYVVCGHIHKPAKRDITTEKGSVVYLNSGDWVENLTALEYHGGKWSVYHYKDDPRAQSIRLPKRFRRSDNGEVFQEVFTSIMKNHRK
ncbi:MAG: UDP-2,3-diacylglucosamine diphosphatase, partial [Bacteroidota bacterium]